MVKFKCFSICYSHILALDQGVEIIFKHLNLVIGGSLEVRQNWNTILGLKSIGVGCVVNQNHILEVSVDDAQVLYILTFGRQIAVLSVKSVLDVLLLGVEIVDHHIGVALMAGCEYHKFELFVQRL